MQLPRGPRRDAAGPPLAPHDPAHPSVPAPAPRHNAPRDRSERPSTRPRPGRTRRGRRRGPKRRVPPRAAPSSPLHDSPTALRRSEGHDPAVVIVMEQDDLTTQRRIDAPDALKLAVWHAPEHAPAWANTL